ncbi:MAG: hypothetical protein MUF86_17590 [Akkermansiaceae bacterium]|jgi:hypothetical protein|nr:hypothetical protein [Akkermansiaceae bacterium]
MPPPKHEAAVVPVDDVGWVVSTALRLVVQPAMGEDLALDGAAAMNPQACACRVMDRLFAVLAADASLQKSWLGH